MNLNKVKKQIRKDLHFIRHDIWRVTEGEVPKSKGRFYNVIKTVLIVFRNVKEDQLNTKASALTYSTLLAIVPALAVVFAIAKGFGFQNIINNQLMHYFQGHETVMGNILGFVDNYLEHAKSGVFMGIGIFLLLYTVFNLITNIEQRYNDIWRVKKARKIYRRITDYFSMMLIFPVFIVFSSGLSVFISSTVSLSGASGIFSPVIGVFMNLVPFLLTIIMLFLTYVFIPNTKVQVKHAILPAVFSGTAFQIFQLVYIGGQIWISKYNAIYGSFAVLPLLLLWLQVSWLICLLGVEFCFVSQNLNRFSFEKEIKNISRRYHDFLTLVMMSLIIKKFDEGEDPYTAEKIADEYKIPIELTNDILDFLEKLKFVRETPTKDERITAFLPAMDTHTLTVGSLLDKIDKYGSEGFKIDKNIIFHKEWQTILDTRQSTYEKNKDLLIRDL